MDTVNCIVIVGAGLAGTSAADELRQCGYRGRLLLLGDEARLPYQRPPLSKEALAGQMDAPLLYPESFYAEHKIELLTDAPVTEVELGEWPSIVTASGERIQCDRLLLATGSTARQLPIDPSIQADIFVLRTAADMERLRPHLKSGVSILVVGGGVIGLEVASTSLVKGCKVTVVEKAAELMPRMATPELAQWLFAEHSAAGVQVLLSTAVTSIKRGREGYIVMLTNGSSLSVDLVVAGVGVTPNVELALACGLEVNDGVCVDAQLRTNHKTVFAAGDVCNYPAPEGGRLRLEMWQGAEQQGRAAARSMLGFDANCNFVPWFWTDQLEANIQVLGIGEDWDSVVRRSGNTSGQFALFYLKNRRLARCVMVNFGRLTTQARKLMEHDAIVDATRLSDAAVAIKHCVAID